ncbi:glycosyltransferase family 4 protein [Rhodovulum marinum]|uniref:Glycosyltransferase involved in cell wall biosynthesis n=1 Tax=Rhodovulum marinum TaxID=320662 RepID=A0A4R2PTR3_9RHOB|nr:glycosyltransferase family 1 protein [Rhodovulum marinum]TCP39289.1 glycosyltransferase involved in cell wall biosynthesis [Rhodovulum marinum]
MIAKSMPKQTLAILTNARAADQRSMIGYGEMVLEAARQSGHEVVEFRPASLLGRLLPERIQGPPRKFANNLDRFVVTPLKFAGRKADIVHVVDPGNAVYLPLIRHRRSIVTVHDMIPYLARDGKLPGWRPTLTGRWLMNRITAQLAKVDHIVCISHATRRDLLAYVDIPEACVRIIHNAVFQPMAPASPEACADLRVRLGLPAGAPLILHVGRNWYKNRETVLEVAARVRETRPDVHLVMVGALPPALEAQAERLGLGPELHVIERIERADMATLYTTAAVLLFPSYYEGFGLPVLEAQMCGTPVVCSDRGALPEVGNSYALLCDPKQVRALSSATLNALATDGIETLPNHFSATNWAKNYRDIYTSSQGALSA